jgi:hypothetical protein
MAEDRWYYGRIWHGIHFAAWLRLLARNRFAISPSRLPPALSITAASLVNTALRRWQTLRYSRRVAQIEITPDPVFIIGHWRTGTTMLHELLALDPRHRCPTSFESFSPNTFLVSERLVCHWLRFVLPTTRPMDNVRLSFDSPQEDEMALCLRGAPSSFATLAFPNHPLQSPRYLDLEDLSPAELEEWENAFRTFLRLLLFRRPGQLILKSPEHTFRVRALSRMFPQARFIHLVRNPYVVFPSMIHTWTKMSEAYGLQKLDPQRLPERVFRILEAMYQRLEEARKFIDPSRLLDLRYEELVRGPVRAVRAVYERFDWPDFDLVRPAIGEYAERAKGFQTNRYAVPPELRREISRRWAPYFEKYGYKLADDNSASQSD